MGKVTKTIKQRLDYQLNMAAWFEATKTLFNQVVAFYFDVIQAHPGILDLNDHEALIALEKLTHATKVHPNPLMPLAAINDNIPVAFRRAAIMAALGSARSFSSNFARWQKKKAQKEARGKKYTVRPPVPPRTWNRSPVLYAGMWKEREAHTIMLKLWTGTSWAWVKMRITVQEVLEAWELASPSLVKHGSEWWLHTPLEKRVKSPGPVAEQL
jgi:hypothetical protein